MITTAQELIDYMYDENLSHFEFDENMGGEDCDCHLHNTIKTMVRYLEEMEC
jgi:hypothetical protein